MRHKCLIIILMSYTFLSGCMTAAQHHEALPSTQERKLTIGLVQKEIRQGMPQSTVAEVLGSPNIVSKESSGEETWIYDKVSTDVAYSKSSGGVGALVLGGGGNVAGGGGAGYGASSGAMARTQRTLTIIIRFKAGVVNEISYHTSSF
jgi:outer membrane protein assembly factor BamE (lipoprotein component of BamABCDE complex)